MKHSEWIASRIAGPGRDVSAPDSRIRIGLLEGWASISVNILLFFVKGGLGLLTGSVALIADAAHSLSDSVTSVVVIVGFRMSRKPPDPEHPFGHGRVESVAGVVIAVLLGVMAVEMFKASLSRLLKPEPITVEVWVIAILAATVLAKEWLTRFSADLGRLIGSETLQADAAHHRSDVWTTLLVIVAFIGAKANAYWLDGGMGMIVAIVIGWAAVQAMRGATGPLIGQAAPDDTIAAIQRIASSVAGVNGVHDILVQRYGSTNVISLHIEVSASVSAMRLHEMSEDIEERIVQRFPGYAMVHVDPLDRDHEHYAAVDTILKTAFADEAGVTSFHDLRLLGGPNRFRVVFDVSTTPAPEGFDKDRVHRKVVQAVAERFPLARVTMNVDPPYLRTPPGQNGTSDELSR